PGADASHHPVRVLRDTVPVRVASCGIEDGEIDPGRVRRGVQGPTPGGRRLRKDADDPQGPDSAPPSLEPHLERDPCLSRGLARRECRAEVTVYGAVAARTVGRVVKRVDAAPPTGEPLVDLRLVPVVRLLETARDVPVIVRLVNGDDAAGCIDNRSVLA